MPIKLEVFRTPESSGDAPVVVASTELEDMRLAAYDKGYGAGWEDAMAAAKAEGAQISSELAHNLQNLSFTYHEARSHILRGLRPVLTALTEKLLPELAQQSLSHLVLDTLTPLLDDGGEGQVTLTLHPASRAKVERLLTEAAGLSVTIREDACIGQGQVYLQLGHAEQGIDLDRALAEISRAVHDFFDFAEKDNPHG